MLGFKAGTNHAPDHSTSMTHALAILVVEDEALIALEIEAELLREGAEVVGPCATLRDCLSTIDNRQIDAAILDVDLNGEAVFPAAERLRDQGIPFVFHTGYGDASRITCRFPDATVCSKPLPVSELLSILLQRLGPRLA